VRGKEDTTDAVQEHVEKSSDATERPSVLIAKATEPAPPPQVTVLQTPPSTVPEGTTVTKVSHLAAGSTDPEGIKDSGSHVTSTTAVPAQIVKANVPTA